MPIHIFFELNPPLQAGVFCGSGQNIMVLNTIRVKISVNPAFQVETNRSGQLMVTRCSLGMASVCGALIGAVSSTCIC